MSKKLFLLISFVVVLVLVGSAAAADKTWTGAVSTDWFDDNNWDPAGVPVGGYSEFTGDVVHINSGVPNFPVINTTDPCAWCRKLWLGSAGSGDSYLTIEDGGELTVRSYDTSVGNQTFVLGKANGTHGILNMTGGTINMAPGMAPEGEEQMEVGGRGSFGRGTFNMTGGQFNNGHIVVPGYGGVGISAVNLDGGVIDCNTFAWSQMTKSGTLNIYSGTLICDLLRFVSGGFCNLYGGEIHSLNWSMWDNYGGFDIYDGVWYIRGYYGRTYTARYFTNHVNDNGDYNLVAYGGRGPVLIEWTNMNHPDPNQVIAEEDLGPLMDYTDPNTYDPNVFWWVSSGFDSDLAYWPNPVDGYGAASPEQTLSWTPAYNGNAEFHDVYFGTDYNDVNNATVADPCGVYIGRRDTNSITRVEYNPADILVMGPTYYWRIDEVNDADPCSPWKGTVWSFSISYVSIDNFESYFTNDELKVEWKDNADPENSTYCYAFSKDDQALDSRSMYLTCMNGFGPLYYGEVWHNFAQPQDWTPAGTDARLLAMSYYGKIDNEDAGLYMKLKDSLGTEATQWISKDPNTCKVASWTEALLPLNGFGSVDMSKISRVTIGVGLDPTAPSGMVYIWVDNVRLYLPECNTSYLRAPGDINGDCTTNFSDLDILVAQGNWLVRNWDVEVIAPVGDPCLWYKFDGNALDSSGNGYDGTVTDPCDPNYVTGHSGQALVFNGSTIDPTYVDVPLDFLSAIDREITVSVWLNNPHSGTRTVFAGEPNEGEWGERILYLVLLGDTADVFIGNETYYDPNGAADSLNRATGTGEFVDLWTHWAVTKDCDANEMAIYVNGELLTSESFHLNAGSYNVPIAGIDSFIIGCNQRYDGGYAGLMDDFRVYDYAMSHGEILALAGESIGSTFTQPFQRLLMTSANINLYDDATVDVIDFRDYAVLANTWLQTWILGDYPDIY